MLRRCDWIIYKVKSRYYNLTHKFGINMPKTVDESYKIDKQNDNTLWTDSFNKELKIVQPSFKVM